MRSHYSTRDHRCYAELWLNSDPRPPSRSVFFEAYLVDVDENHGIAELRQETGATVLICRVADRKCANSDEWSALIKPYIDQ